MRDGPAAARRALDELVADFGRDRVIVELWDHGAIDDVARNDVLAEIYLAWRRSDASPAQRRLRELVLKTVTDPSAPFAA